MYSQDFSQDLEVTMNRLLYGDPFSLIRFGDGERALCEGRDLKVDKPFEYWESKQNQPTRFVSFLQDSCQHKDDPDYYIGISCPCCDEPAFRWYLGKVRVKLPQLTYANLWVNNNWSRWMEFYHTNKIREKVLLVSSAGGDYQVPRDAVTHEWGLEKLVGQLIAEADKPILVAAGPAANVIAYLYWTQAPVSTRQTILDIGSSLDLEIHGEVTRCYQFPDKRSPYAERICHWG